MIRKQKGIALLEALIACVILAIGLIGAIGLQARAAAALAQADMRAEATIASEKLLGMMSNDVSSDGNQLAYKKTETGSAPAVIAAWHAETIKAIPGALISIGVTPMTGFKTYQVEIVIKWTRRAGEPENQHRTVSYTATT